VWAVTNRPRRLTAAAEADRQLHLADLLSTASLLPRDTTDPFEQSVRALATAHSAQTAPSAIILHRYGARGWGGIALAAAAVAALALFTADSPRTQATAATPAPKSWQDLEPDRAAIPTPKAPDPRRPKVGLGSDETNPTPSADPITQQATNTTANESANPNSANTTSDPGAGRGSAQSTPKPTPTDPLNPTPGIPRPNTTGQTPSGGGAGTSSSQANSESPAGLTTTPPPAARRPAPVWRSNAWPSDRDHARDALREGRIADRYRDLVRDYFERE
jgi:hypothetical protein